MTAILAPLSSGSRLRARPRSAGFWPRSTIPHRPVNEVTRQNFGLLIAYILPGFVALWGAVLLSPPLRSTLEPLGMTAASIEGAFLITLAALAAGMTVSAARWAIVDTFHHCTGLVRPRFDDANLPDRLPAFASIVDDNYRYYQWHANTAVALGFLYGVWRFQHPTLIPTPPWADVTFVLIETLFLATSRDNLRKYYARAARLLGSLPPLERSDSHVERQPPAEARRQAPNQGEALGWQEGGGQGLAAQ